MQKWILVLSSIMFSGCASLDEAIEAYQYQPDLPIMVEGNAYQVNIIKCAKIRDITEDDRLVCYDAEGNKSASISPVSDFRVNYFKDRGIEWGSVEHQAFVYNFLYNGGMEMAVDSFAQSVSTIKENVKTTKKFLDTIDKTEKLHQKKLEFATQSVASYMEGGFEGWMSFQTHRIHWYLDNSKDKFD